MRKVNRGVILFLVVLVGMLFYMYAQIKHYENLSTIIEPQTEEFADMVNSTIRSLQEQQLTESAALEFCAHAVQQYPYWYTADQAQLDGQAEGLFSLYRSLLSSNAVLQAKYEIKDLSLIEQHQHYYTFRCSMLWHYENVDTSNIVCDFYFVQTKRGFRLLGTSMWERFVEKGRG